MTVPEAQSSAAGPTDGQASLVAAAEVALRVGLGASRPTLLETGSVFVVALEPLPVIARVGLVADASPWITSPATQVELAAFAAADGGPVVSPLTTVDPGPHRQGQFLITLWERVADLPVDAGAVGRSLRRLHASIAAFAGTLPSFDPLPGVRRIADALPPASAARVILFEACDACVLPDLPEQPLHGDAHRGNALGTSSGPRWNDFEYACIGPVEWDLASMAHRARVLGERAAETEAMLRAYGNDAQDRSLLLTGAYALHAAAQTVAAAVARPGLRPLAERRLAWVRRQLH